MASSSASFEAPYLSFEGQHSHALPSGRRSIYTPAQITQYLAHIQFPLTLLEDDKRDLPFLQALHAHHIAFFPYENLALHYNPAHANSLDPQVVFEKHIPNLSPSPSHSTRPPPAANPSSDNPAGRGGYCLETAVLYQHVLLALGFEAYPTLARIRLREAGIPRGPFVGFRHVTNIITLSDGSRWSAVVGFGGDGATGPMRLVDAPLELGERENSGESGPRLVVQEPGGAVGVGDGGAGARPTSVRRNLGAQEVRLVRRAMPDDDEALLGAAVEASLRGKPAWFYEYRNTQGADWNAYYAFGEGEANGAEMHTVNEWVSRNEESFQRHQVLVVKFIFAEGVVPAENERDVKDVPGLRIGRRGAASWLVQSGAEGSGGEGRLAGKLMLADGLVKRNLGGKTEVLKECKTEEERVWVLREWFGIELTDEQKRGIRGHRTELVGSR